MIRAFEDGQRIATAVTFADGTILQVFPSKQAFATQDLWKAKYPQATFELGNEHVPWQERQEKSVQKLITNYLSTPRPNDTEMQRTVRQLYFQLNLRNSVPSTMTQFHGYGSGVRQESGLHVFIPQKGLITPVYYNYVTGRVFFDNCSQEATPTAGLVFFRKHGTNLKVVVPYLEEPNRQQKTVIYRSEIYRQYEGIELDVLELRQAGFNVLYFHRDRYCGPDTMKVLAKQPGISAVLHNNYGNTTVFTPDGNQERVDFRQWLLKQQIALNP